MQVQFLNAATVTMRASFSGATLRKRIRLGLWPRPAAISERLRAWPAFEVDAMLVALASGASDDEIRSLVRGFEDKRPGSIRPSLANQNPALISGRNRYFDAVRAGVRPAPRAKRVQS